MERTEFIQKMHDLRAEQIENKKNYQADKNATKDSFTAVIQNRKKEHQAEMKELTDDLKNQLKVLDENYAAAQRAVDDKMLAVKLEYFKDHELEKVS